MDPRVYFPPIQWNLISSRMPLWQLHISHSQKESDFHLILPQLHTLS